MRPRRRRATVPKMLVAVSQRGLAADEAARANELAAVKAEALVRVKEEAAEEEEKVKGPLVVTEAGS